MTLRDAGIACRANEESCSCELRGRLKQAAKSWQFHNVLHIHRTCDKHQADLNEKAPFPGLLQSPLTDSNR